MRIAVFGLGYVGTVAAACLARDGHTVTGVDPNTTKVDHSAVSSGRLSATADAGRAVSQCELSLVCVGTPSRANGSLDTKYVQAVCREIGAAIYKKGKGSRHTVAIRSTLLPGTMRGIVIPSLESSSHMKAGGDFGLCHNPEFLREGSAVYDYDNPPKTVIGQIDSASGDALIEIYKSIEAPAFRTSLGEAEMVKYVDNVWHALKICFANEIGNISKEAGLNSCRIMEIFCQDVKLNISSAYLRPGFAFGGSCLPKDVRALTYHARSRDVTVPVLDAIMSSNKVHIDKAFDTIINDNARRIGFLGFSFKEGTDDLRESPAVELIERLIGKGYELCLYDRNVQLASLVGANRDYILNHIPHIARLMTDNIDTVLSTSETIVIGNNDPEFRKIIAEQAVDRRIIDLVGVGQSLDDTVAGYEGICW
jgi:GDP-mannose 6-dehydrogenase